MNWGLLGVVMLGGALGAATRLLLGDLLVRRVGEAWPWGTLASNLLGSFAVGLVFSLLQDRGPSALYWRAFLIVGLIGGLTTWSALMLETLLYARTARTGTMLAYFATTLAGGLLLVWLGARLGDWLRG
jgi:CrcB protein